LIRDRRRGSLGRSLALAGLLSTGLTGCTDFAMYDLDVIWGSIPFMSTLRNSVAYDPYEIPRLPAQGSVPVASPTGEILPAFTQAQLDSVGAALTNELPASPEVLARGQEVYNVHCVTCHGPQGGGNGPIIGPGKYPFAPALAGAGATSVGRPDGYIYGIIRVGRGLMPQYGERIRHNDRWAVVHYVRQLQRQGGGTPVVAPAAAATPAPVGSGQAGAGAPATPPATPPADTAQAQRL
jgi:mono/diheme cytochrome c family protein